MTTEEMKKRGIRTTNLKLDLYKKLMIYKVEHEYESLSSLVNELYTFYIQKNKKLAPRAK